MVLAYSTSNAGKRSDDGPIAFTVMRTGSEDEIKTASSVQFLTQDDTARAGTDYTATSGALAFAAGDTEKTVAVELLGSIPAGKPSLTFHLLLGGGSGANGTIDPSDTHDQDETTDIYDKHYAVLVPRDDASGATDHSGDYFRYGTKNTEKNFMNHTKSIERDIALKTPNVPSWLNDAGGDGIFNYTSDDRTRVVLGESYDVVKKKAYFYYDEKQEIVGDENIVDGVRRMGGGWGEYLNYEISSTVDFEARAAARLEFDASVKAAVEVGASIEAKYGLAFESGLAGTIAAKTGKNFEFSALGGFESGIGEYAYKKEYAILADDELFLSVLPSDVLTMGWKIALGIARGVLVTLTHTANAAYIGFAAYSIAIMGQIQQDDEKVETPVTALRAISIAQGAIGACWLVLGIVYELKIRGVLHAAGTGDKPFIRLTKNGQLVLGSGGMAQILLSGNDALITGENVRMISQQNAVGGGQGSVVVRAVGGSARLVGDNGLTVSSGAALNIDGVGVTSNSRGQAWQHTGDFTANGNIQLGPTTATSLNVTGAPVGANVPGQQVATDLSLRQLRVQIASAAGRALQGGQSGRAEKLNALLTGLRNLPI